MIVKIKRVDGCTEMFETSSFTVCKAKEMHPAILKVKVWSDSGLLLKFWRRPFPHFYSKFMYKPESVELKSEFGPQDKAEE